MLRTSNISTTTGQNQISPNITVASLNQPGLVSSSPIQGNNSVSVNTSVPSISHLNSNPIAGSNKAYYPRN